jgi:alcohol dehydrogenase, propanol-preferring
MMLENIQDLKKEKEPLKLFEQEINPVRKFEILIKVYACGVCHTELDEIEGRTPPKFFPIIPGHQVVGKIVETGAGTSLFKVGERVGVAWINSACGKCKYCLEGNENLCAEFKATGRDVNGGYANYILVNENFVYKIPDIFTDAEAAPLLCAGAIGYRSIKLTNLKDGDILGLTGFGASAHLVLKMAKHKFPNSRFFIFARSEKEREFAKEIGIDWTGNTEDIPPEKIDSVIDTTPVWKPVIEALKNLKPGGRLVINAIRKEENDIKEFLKLNYENHLWMEKEIKSVANVSRADVKEFLDLAASIPIKPEVEEYPLEDANKALIELKNRKIRGAKVLRIN